MAVGPGVAFTNTYVHDNSILRNNLHDLGEGVMSDLGCVHFANLGGSSYGGGDSFQNNICHDITHALLGLGSAIGLYIDNNSQRVTASSNLVYRTSGALFLDNASPSCSVTCNNTLSNNILAYSMQGPTRRGGNDPGLTFTFQNNVVYYDNNGPQAVNDDGTGFWNCNGNCPLRFSFISNDYFSPTIGAPHFITTAPDNTWDFAGWQGSPPNEDSGSKNLDPLFGNPAFSSGFTVDPTVAGMIGFITSDFSKTYTAGRSQHSISPPSTGATFPLQLLAPSQF